MLQHSLGIREYRKDPDLKGRPVTFEMFHKRVKEKGVTDPRVLELWDDLEEAPLEVGDRLKVKKDKSLEGAYEAGDLGTIRQIAGEILIIEWDRSGKSTFWWSRSQYSAEYILEAKAWEVRKGAQESPMLPS